MATFINHAADVSGLQLSMRRALEQIDCALDKGDRRAFRVWSARWRQLAAKVEGLLVKIATAEET
jgi:hypothetical protein